MSKRKELKSNRDAAMEQYVSAADFGAQPPLVDSYASLICSVRAYLECETWDAILAIRDWSQVALAEIQDQRLAATKAEIARLSGDLAARTQEPTA